VRRVKRVLRRVLFGIPGGKWFYRRVYASAVARWHRGGRGSCSAGLWARWGGQKRLRAALLDLLRVEEEWVNLLRQATEHFEFLRRFLTPLDGSEEAAQATLEEFRRHLGALILVFRSLLARQETQLAFARGLLQKTSGRASPDPQVVLGPTLLVLEDKWIPLLQEAKDSLGFLRDSLHPGKDGEPAPERVLQELQRQLDALTLAFQGLLAWREAQGRLARALPTGGLELPHLDREARLEKVVEYLVNMQGDDPPP